MIEALDHIAVAVRDLDLAATAYQALLGRPPDWREEAAGARHAWFQVGAVAVDLVQPEGAGESGDRVRARLAAGAEGLWGLAFAVRDLEETRRILARRGAPVGEAADLLSTDAWKLAFLEPAATHGVPIALTERARRPAPTGRGDAALVQGLDHVVIRTDDADRAAALYGARLGLDLRLDRANPAWRARLLFFRCGGSVVEVSAPLERPAKIGADRLSGLAWRVGDPVAARQRIASAGFDVSEVRAGRKPGTAVFTVRSGAPGAPTLMIGEGAQAA